MERVILWLNFMETLAGQAAIAIQNALLYEARHVIADYGTYYNHQRPHSALKYLCPYDYYRGDPVVLLAQRERRRGNLRHQDPFSRRFLRVRQDRLARPVDKEDLNGLAEERHIEYTNGDVGLLTSDAELNLIRKMLALPEIVELAATNLEPHHLPYFAQELATAFHSFYKQCRVISEDKALTGARLKLVEAAKVVLARTLHLMGMTAPALT
jgi:hypothetical protein